MFCTIIYKIIVRTADNLAISHLLHLIIFINILLINRLILRQLFMMYDIYNIYVIIIPGVPV